MVVVVVDAFVVVVVVVDQVFFVGIERIEILSCASAILNISLAIVRAEVAIAGNVGRECKKGNRFSWEKKCEGFGASKGEIVCINPLSTGELAYMRLKDTMLLAVHSIYVSYIRSQFV